MARAAAMVVSGDGSGGEGGGDSSGGEGGGDGGLVAGRCGGVAR